MSQPKSNRRYAECLGLPGSGKSTISTKLALLGGGVVPSHLYPKKSTSLLFTLTHPVLTITLFLILFWEVTRTGTWRLLSLKISLLFNTFGRLASIETQKGITILDEGMYQRLLSLLETKHSPNYFKKVLNILPTPSVCVLVTGTENDHEDAFRRYLHADNPRALCGEAYLRAWKKTITHNLDALTEAVRARGVQVIEVSVADELTSVYNALTYER